MFYNFNPVTHRGTTGARQMGLATNVGGDDHF
ncbi:hypothetical protein AD47_3382, partial [Escherichia coli 6-319-05_S4_C3]